MYLLSFSLYLHEGIVKRFLEIDLSSGHWSLIVGSFQNRKVAGSIPGQATCLGCGFDPWSRRLHEATNWSFSFAPMFLSLPSSFSKSNEKTTSREDTSFFKKEIDLKCQDIYFILCHGFSYNLFLSINKLMHAWMEHHIKLVMKESLTFAGFIQ